MEDNKDKIQDNERQEIENAINALEEDIKTDDVNRIKLGIENLQKSMYSFSQRIYQTQAQEQTYQQAAEQAQRAASGMGETPPGGMGGAPPGDMGGAGGASYKAEEKKDDDKKKVVDVDWDEDEEEEE